MKKVIATTATGLMLLVGLSGCGGTPKCSDSETKDLVIEIAKGQLKKAGMGSLIPKLDFEVENIRTTKHHKDVDSYECAADFKMEGDKVKTLPITYTVQSTDDGDKFYVNVYGF